MTARLFVGGLLSIASVAACAAVGCSSSTASNGGTDGGGGAGADGGLRTTGLAQICTRGGKAKAVPTTCNGAAELCDRTFDKVVVPMTHNAMSNTEDGFDSPNQTHTLRKQLDDGVRGMMLDLHYADPESKEGSQDRLDDVSTVDQIWLCHGTCILGRSRLLDGLCTITKFLDENPGEIVSIIFETRVKDVDAAEVIAASGLEEYAFVHSPGAPWPTLRSLVDTGKRAVLFVETGGGSPAYLHPAFDGNIVDTPYSFTKASDFSCRVNRGKAGDPLFLVNHWLGNPLPAIGFAREVNPAAVLGKRIEDCTREAGRAPTFVGVDFYEVGDLMPVVRKANGLAP